MFGVGAGLTVCAGFWVVEAGFFACRFCGLYLLRGSYGLCGLRGLRGILGRGLGVVAYDVVDCSIGVGRDGCLVIALRLAACNAKTPTSMARQSTAEISFFIVFVLS